MGGGGSHTTVALAFMRDRMAATAASPKAAGRNVISVPAVLFEYFTQIAPNEAGRPARDWRHGLRLSCRPLHFIIMDRPE
jgi:hypothetical protein